MKLKIYFLVVISLLFTLGNSLNLKNSYNLKVKKLEANADLPGWGNILSGVQDIKKGAQNLVGAGVNKLAEAKKDLAGHINKGVDAVANTVNKGASKVAGALGVDSKKFEDSVAGTADKTKKAVNCFLGKCDDGTTDEKKKHDEGKVVPDSTHPKKADEGNDDLKEFGDNHVKPSNETISTQTTDIIDIKPDPNFIHEKSGESSISSEEGSSSEEITTTTTYTTTEVVETVLNEEFTMNKKSIQLEIDPRYQLMKMQDDYMNPDNTLRFVATDSTDLESVSLKLYFKGTASDRVFFSQNNDPTFTNSINDCKNYKVINNRLYNKPVVNNEPIDDKKDKAIFDDLRVPRCLTIPDNGNLKTNYINVFSLPEGTRLDRKCLKGESLTKQNSCMSYIRTISIGLLHGLKVLNMGNSFYRHGNIFPHNIYLNIKNDAQRVFLDNMLYDNNKYDDINQKPFRRDMNMMADTLVSILTGTATNILKDPVKSTFEIYHTIKKYLWDNNIDLSLKSSSINMASSIKEGSGKCLTRAEMEFKLQKTVFNFIYRLKCTGIDPNNQFMDIDQALNHEFITSGSLVGPTAPGEQWDSLPADY